MCNDYYLTDLCLVHFHCRNLEQMKEKIKNNIIGLGYSFDLNSLKDVILKNNNCAGHHHIKNQIQIFENTYSLQEEQIHKNDILLQPLTERIRNGFF